MRAPVGREVGLYLDDVGAVDVVDVIQTPTGRRYGVTKVRQQQRGKHAGRFHLRAVVLGEDDPISAPLGSRIILIHWYKRARRLHRGRGSL